MSPIPRPFLHCLCYGDPGAGKSQFAASFPKPMLVWHFDPYGKDVPYLRAGTPKPLEMSEDGIPYREVMGRRGTVAVRLEYYLDPDMTQPSAYAHLLRRLTLFQHEQDQWATVVLDSMTFAELAARKWHQYTLNKTAKDPRQWFGGSTDLLEELLMGRLAALPLNVVILAHVDEDKDELHGTFVRNPKLPGRLRKGSGCGYGEFYHAFVRRSPETQEREYLIQTKSDAIWNASTQIDAPELCPNHYEALWANWQA